MLDNFLYGQVSLLDCCSNRRFEVVLDDCKDEDTVRKLVKGADVILQLTAYSEAHFPCAQVNSPHI